MPIITLILAEEEKVTAKERAVELHALSTGHPFLTRAQVFEDVAWRQVGAATAGLRPDVVASAQERGRALDWWATVEELLVELQELGWGEKKQSDTDHSLQGRFQVDRAHHVGFLEMD